MGVDMAGIANGTNPAAEPGQARQARNQSPAPRHEAAAAGWAARMAGSAHAWPYSGNPNRPNKIARSQPARLTRGGIVGGIRQEGDFAAQQRGVHRIHKAQVGLAPQRQLGVVCGRQEEVQRSGAVRQNECRQSISTPVGLAAQRQLSFVCMGRNASEAVQWVARAGVHTAEAGAKLCGLNASVAL